MKNLDRLLGLLLFPFLFLMRFALSRYHTSSLGVGGHSHRGRWERGYHSHQGRGNIVFNLLFLSLLSVSQLHAGDVTSPVTLNDGVNPSDAGEETQKLQSGKDCVILTPSVNGTLTTLEIKSNDKKIKFKISDSSCGDSKVNGTNYDYSDYENQTFETFLSNISMITSDKIYIEFDKVENNGRGYVRATFDVPSSNTSPVADPQSITVDENSTNNAITLTGSDLDGDTLSYSIVTNPTHGTLSGTAPNVTYTPTAGYHGTDSFTFKVNDGTDDSSDATVSITVTEGTPPPSGGGDLFGDVQCGPLNTLKKGPGITFGGAITVKGSGGSELQTPSLPSGAHDSTCDGATCTADGTGVDPISFTVGKEGGTGANITQTSGDLILKDATNSLADVIHYVSGKIDADNTLLVDGHVELHTAGDAVFKFKKIIFKDADASLQLFAEGKVELVSDLVVSGDGFTSSPNQFQILTHGDVFTGSGNTNGVIRALIYADGTVTYEGATSSRTTPDFYGSITANKIITGSNGYITSEDNEGCGGTTPPLTYNPGVVDAVDIYAHTATTPFYDAIIKTKISGQTSVTLDAVYLGTDMTADTVYNAADMPVLMSIYYPALGRITKLYEADGRTPLAAVIVEGAISGTTPLFTIPASAAKEAYILMKYIDYQALITDGGPNCLQNSSQGANAVPGLPSCVASDVQYLDAFHQEAFDRCKVSNGDPCKPSHHGFSGGGDPTYPGYNPIYDHKYGCYECTLGATPQVRSVDNFAIRPKDFNLSIPSSDFPNLLRAGQDYNVSLTARNYNGATSGDFNITDHNWVADLDANTTKYFKDNTTDTAGLLHGSAEVNTSVTAYSLGGLSSDSNTSVPSSAEAVIPVSYDDVGKVNLQLYDTVWSAVDNDDTPMDCDDSHAHTYVCGDVNVTFIPHHFNVENIHLRNHRDGNLTYLSRDLNMSAHIDANISARNADNGITQNFRANDTNQFYENPVSVDLNVTDWNVSQPSRHPLGNVVHLQDIPVPALLGFGGVDANGTHNIDWNESNGSQRLMFNYARDINQTVNPFDVPGTDINVSVQSTYSDGSTPSSPVNINGTGIGDQNATFYFARAKSSQYFYDDVTANSIDTPISVVVYRDPGTSTFGLDLTLFQSTDEFDWYLSTPHNMSNGDGNITLQALSGGSVNPAHPNTVNISNGIDNNVSVSDGGSTIRPLDVNITFGSGTSSWLIYNKDANATPNPFYKVRFIGGGTGSWTGQGQTGHVVGDEIKKEKTKRLGW